MPSSSKAIRQNIMPSNTLRDNANILVSVIMPLFNHEKYVAQAITSILAQTHKNLELIIIDDGSTDDSGAIAQTYARQDNRVKYQFQKNTGVAMARNRGCKMARGTVVAWQDADDFSHPQRLEQQLQSLQGNIGAVGCWLQPVNADGKNFAAPEYLAPTRPDKTPEDKTKYLIGGKEYGYANLPSFLIKKKYIGRGFRNLRVGEDMDLIFRVEEKTKMLTIPQALYYYRHHDNNSQQRLVKKNISKRLEITFGNLVYFLSAYARRIYGTDPLAHLPITTPLAQGRYLCYFACYLRLYRFIPRILRINKMSWVEFMGRLLFINLQTIFLFSKRRNEKKSFTRKSSKADPADKCS